ncbi:hypothetical protein DFH09DRAFT_1107206 [Mycena vulgaris]|nr:hypothetical protein DFH09DRAFT_1107206 [Mycena vulgaris]
MHRRVTRDSKQEPGELQAGLAAASEHGPLGMHVELCRLRGTTLGHVKVVGRRGRTSIPGAMSVTGSCRLKCSGGGGTVAASTAKADVTASDESDVTASDESDVTASDESDVTACSIAASWSGHVLVRGGRKKESCQQEHGHGATRHAALRRHKQLAASSGQCAQLRQMSQRVMSVMQQPVASQHYGPGLDPIPIRMGDALWDLPATHVHEQW